MLIIVDLPNYSYGLPEHILFELKIIGNTRNNW